MVLSSVAFQGFSVPMGTLRSYLGMGTFNTCGNQIAIGGSVTGSVGGPSATTAFRFCLGAGGSNPRSARVFWAFTVARGRAGRHNGDTASQRPGRRQRIWP